MHKPYASRQSTLPKTSLSRTGERRETLLDRIKTARSNLLANPGFQKFCAAFWPTRFITRSKAAEVFDLCAGFVYTQVLLTCVRLNLLKPLREQSLTLEEIGDLAGLPSDGTWRLVQAAVSLDIIEQRSEGRYGLGPVGAAVIGNPGLQGMIAHHEHFYADLADPVSLLKARSKHTELAKYWLYSPDDVQTPSERAAMAAYSDLMSTTQVAIADEVLRAYPFRRHSHVMDVGGGDGTFLGLAHDRYPHLELSLFELPTVVEIADQRLGQAGVPVATHAGNMFEDEWPGGADLITLIRVALDHDDHAVERLLKRARKALKPGGVLLLAEPMSDSPKVGHAYFGLYLWAMGSGRARSSEELRVMLNRAGFAQTKLLGTGLPDIVRVIRAS